MVDSIYIKLLCGCYPKYVTSQDSLYHMLLRLASHLCIKIKKIFPSTPCDKRISELSYFSMLSNKREKSTYFDF